MNPVRSLGRKNFISSRGEKQGSCWKKVLIKILSRRDYAG